MNDAKTNKRLGIKISRSTLLPPYLASNPYFKGYVDAVDAVMGPTVDEKTEVVANLRNMWVQNPDTETYVEQQLLIDKSKWSIPERAILVQQANLLGMKLQNAGVVDDDSYQAITRFVGQYWFGKGTQAFIDFINYCLSSDLQVVPMWTQDYVNFVHEGNPAIGTPVWEGGAWYPTTHVVIIAKGGLQQLDILTLQSFFYEIANYNLVLQAIDASFDMPVVPTQDDTVTKVVALALYGVNEFAIANFDTYGTTPPDSHTATELPSTYYTMGAPKDISTCFLLAQPSGWILLDGKKIPVYGYNEQLTKEEADIGLDLIGHDIGTGIYNLIYGPVIWIPVPGSTRGTARIPSYATNNLTIADGINVAAKSVGRSRTLLLTNPQGFVELQPSHFVPWW